MNNKDWDSYFKDGNPSLKQERENIKKSNNSVLIICMVILLIVAAIGGYIVGTNKPEEDKNLPPSPVVKPQNETTKIEETEIVKPDITNTTIEKVTDLFDENSTIELDQYKKVTTTVGGSDRKDTCISPKKELVNLYYKSKEAITGDISKNYLGYDYTDYTQYFCYNDMCSYKDIDLKSYYESENSNKTIEYHNILFIIEEGMLRAKYNDVIDPYKSITNAKSLKVTFSAGYGYEIYVLDNKNNIYYLTYLLEEDNKGTWNQKNQVVSDNGTELFYSNVSKFALYETKDNNSGWTEVAVNTIDNKLLVGPATKLQDTREVPYKMIQKTYKDKKLWYNDVTIYLQNKSSSFEKNNKKELIIKNIIFNDYYLYLIDENNNILYYDLKDCKRSYKSYSKNKVVALREDGKKVKVYYDNKTYDEIPYEYLIK